MPRLKTIGSRIKESSTSRKRSGPYVCLHDAFSGEVLGGQSSVKLIQNPGEATRLVVEFVCDGTHVRLDGE